MSRWAQFDEYVQAAMRSWECPGVALAVVQGDAVLHQTVLGLRDVDGQQPLKPHSRFPVASITKSFTAMSAALLVDEGKLEWDKPVREYMPEFVLRDAYVTEHVTVRDMLSHRTGLPRHDWSAWRLDLPRADFVRRMRHFRFSATFREKYQYNNLMYYAAAHLVESLAGQRWEEFVHERIFEPLAMTASSLGPEPPQAGLDNALGYRVDRNDDGGAKGLIATPVGLHTELSPGAAGGLWSTLADLSRWLRVHVNEGQIGERRLVTADTLKQMHLPQTIIPGGGFKEALMGNTIFTYGLGWFIEPYRGVTLIHHGGNVEGHSLIVGFVPQAQVGVVVLTNIGMLPLRDVLLYEAIDRALDLPERDWNARFHTMFDPLIAAEARGKQTAAAERNPSAPPSHPLPSYGGTFEAEGYPPFEVKLDDGTFQARTIGSLDWSTLRHYHYDVFEWHMADFDQWVKVRFQINDQGEIDAVAIPIEPEVESVVFRRRPPELQPEHLAMLAGAYDVPINGIVLTVTAANDKVYATQTGSPPAEITLYKLDDTVIGFRLKRARLDFVRDGDAITRLIFKAPNLTWEAPRIA